MLTILYVSSVLVTYTTLRAPIPNYVNPFAISFARNSYGGSLLLSLFLLLLLLLLLLLFLSTLQRAEPKDVYVFVYV